MAVITVTVLMMCAFWGKKLEKTWCNFLTVFAGMWAVIVGAASLKLYHMHEISRKAYGILLLGVLSYALGYAVYHTYPFRFRLRKDVVKTKTVYTARDRLFKAVVVLIFFVWLFLAFKTFRELRAGVTYEHIRDMYGGFSGGKSLFSNRYIRVVVHAFCVPCVFVIVAKMLVSLFGERYHWFYYALGVMIVGLYCFTTGSRQILLNIIVQIVYLLSLKKHLRISKKLKRRILAGLFFVAIGIAVITIFRPGRSTDVVWTTQMTLYAYLSLPLPMLTYWTKTVDVTGVRTYGYGFFKGICSVLSRFKVPLPAGYYEASEKIALYSDKYVPMFGTKGFNAFLSVFFYFYLDFGFFGVMAGSFLFGVLSAAVYRMVKVNRSEFSILLLLLFSIAIIKSFARWEFIKEDYIVTFIIARLLYRKRSIITERGKPA